MPLAGKEAPCFDGAELGPNTEVVVVPPAGGGMEAAKAESAEGDDAEEVDT